MKTNINELKKSVAENSTWTEEFKNGYDYGLWLGLVMALGKDEKQIAKLINELYCE